jgi:hypothetical protein
VKLLARLRFFKEKRVVSKVSVDSAIESTLSLSLFGPPSVTTSGFSSGTLNVFSLSSTSVSVSESSNGPNGFDTIG